MKQFTEAFKKQAIEKFLRRGSKRVDEALEEIGVSSTCIYNWIDKSGKSTTMSEGRRPQDLSLEQKYRAVFDYEKLAEEKRGEFLRREGLHSDHLAKWEREIQACFLNHELDGGLTRAERAKLSLEIKELRMNLSRKDRALAETAALLVLKKKADSIWGTVESE